MRVIRVLFVITLAIALAGGLLFLLAQAVAIVAGQGTWLTMLNGTVKAPIVISASICAILGFLLTYGRPAAPVAPEASDEPR